MKRLLMLIPVFLIFAGCQKKADTTELTKGADNFIHAVDAMDQESISVNTAAGTAKILEEWTAANNDFATAMKEFIRKYPDAVQTQKAPPEVKQSFEVIKHLKRDHGVFLSKMGGLMKRYYLNPDVMEARKRFDESLANVSSIKPPM